LALGGPVTDGERGTFALGVAVVYGPGGAWSVVDTLALGGAGGCGTLVVPLIE
jgi:hypothetical protein